MAACSSGCGLSSSPKACATASKVMSSCVGPMPPAVRTCVKRLENEVTSAAMVATSSGTTETRQTWTPRERSVRQRKQVPSTFLSEQCRQPPATPVCSRSSK